MLENEVIIVDGIPPRTYDAVMGSCVKYALISLPFTIDRMRISSLRQRVRNIAKGKIAEALFDLFCRRNSIYPDFKKSHTPFWKVDRKDFVLMRGAWDLKNNFIYYSGDSFPHKYIDLPALIPNRYQGDQWSKRNKKPFSETLVNFQLFTFLKNADLVRGKRQKEFISIHLSKAQNDFLSKLCQKYRGKSQPSMPFTSNGFWKQMRNRGSQPYFTLNSRPHLIITGYATKYQWKGFRNTGPKDADNCWQEYIQPKWYEKSYRGSCNFLNNSLQTRITNATLPIGMLPSFLSLFPHLTNAMVYGRMKTI